MASVALPIELDPLIAEAKQRARRRRLLLIAAGLIAVGLLAFELASSGAGGGAHGTIPWLPTKPSLGPAHPLLAAPCTASQLRATENVQGAAGNLSAAIDLVNRSSQPCALVGRPNLSFGGWRVTPWQQDGLNSIVHDPLAPSIGSLRALPSGEHVSVLAWIRGYCDIAPTASSRVRALVLTAPGGGRIAVKDATSPACKAPAGLTVQATRYTPVAPQTPDLPLSARIVPAGPHRANGIRIAGPALVARAGSWLSYTVVLKNHTSRAFRFGKTCPSYIEGFTRDVAYVLNCHAVGSIGPWKSVSFAMRVRVPAHLDDLSQLGWSLSPHSHNASAPTATVVLR